MEDTNINFEYGNQVIKIQCSKNEYLKEIIQKFLIKINKDFNSVYFLYDGKKIQENIPIQKLDNKDTEIRILAYDLFPSGGKNNKKVNYSKEIVCPKCEENCIINFNYYKITLNKCINRHNSEFMLLNEFYEYQILKESKMFCDKCKKSRKDIFDNKLYKCSICSINLCPICQIKHKEKNHLIIDYDLKNYFCNIHGEKYISYCKECNKNLCNLCTHNDSHILKYYREILLDKKDLDNTIVELKTKIINVRKEIDNIVNKLNNVRDNLSIYFNVFHNIIKNYNIKFKNYELLKNLNNINNQNKIIIKDINQIINEDKIEKKIKYLFDIYEKMIKKDYININTKEQTDDLDISQNKDSKLAKSTNSNLDKPKPIRSMTQKIDFSNNLVTNPNKKFEFFDTVLKKFHIMVNNLRENAIKKKGEYKSEDIIQEEYILLKRNEKIFTNYFGINLELFNKDNFFEWKCIIKGPEDSDYNGGNFILKIKMTEEYPEKKPKVVFLTPIYHLNVKFYVYGTISIGRFNTKSLSNWEKEYGITEVLKDIFHLFYETDINSLYDYEDGRRKNEFLYKTKLYKDKAKYFSKKYINQIITDNDWDFSYPE